MALAARYPDGQGDGTKAGIPMKRIVTTLLVAGALAHLSGCAAGLSTVQTYPVLDDTPNPTPVPGYRVRCSTTSIFDESFSNCLPAYGPDELVVRARG